MARYIFTRVDPFIQAGSGERFYFREPKSTQEFYVECWSTDNGDGEDIYMVMGSPRGDQQIADSVLFDTGEDREAFDAQLEAFKDDWYDLWRQYVEPQIGRAQRDAIKRMERRHKTEDNRSAQA